MPRSAAQSDFVVHRHREPAPLPAEADPVALPTALWRTPLASERATRLVYWFVGVTLFLLMAVTVVGPHIPSGE